MPVSHLDRLQHRLLDPADRLIRVCSLIRSIPDSVHCSSICKRHSPAAAAAAAAADLLLLILLARAFAPFFPFLLVFVPSRLRSFLSSFLLLFVPSSSFLLAFSPVLVAVLVGGVLISCVRFLLYLELLNSTRTFIFFFFLSFFFLPSFFLPFLFLPSSFLPSFLAWMDYKRYQE